MKNPAFRTILSFLPTYLSLLTLRDGFLPAASFDEKDWCDSDAYSNIWPTVDIIHSRALFNTFPSGWVGSTKDIVTEEEVDRTWPVHQSIPLYRMYVLNIDWTSNHVLSQKIIITVLSRDISINGVYRLPF